MASEAKDENPEHINLKVMGQDGNIVQFKIKKHTALKKLMATYCERAGLALQVRSFKSLKCQTCSIRLASIRHFHLTFK